MCAYWGGPPFLSMLCGMREASGFVQMHTHSGNVFGQGYILQSRWPLLDPTKSLHARQKAVVPRSKVPASSKHTTKQHNGTGWHHRHKLASIQLAFICAITPSKHFQ